jgi:hypothetical protein
LLSLPLLIFVPLGLLAILALLCFVGCNFHPGEIALWTTYTDDTVLANPAVVAYWPLGETGDSLPAIDRTPSPNNGQYIDPATLPAIYPWPDYMVPSGPGTSVESAAAPGSVAFAQPGIVAGDSVQPANVSTNITPCLVVNGCYVNVPLKAKINPTSFTVEAWVRVDWDANAAHAWRVVLDARDFNNPTCTGFGIFAKADDNQPGVYRWQAVVGNGGTGAAGFTTATSDDPPITLNDPSLPAGVTYHLVVTYDSPSQTLILFMDGEQRGPKVNTAYVPNTTQPLWIGAAAPYVPLRPQAPGVLAGPLFPFVGAIQDVAIYNAALASDVILKHYHNGNGVAS